jgi:hypothetical protein
VTATIQSRNGDVVRTTTREPEWGHEERLLDAEEIGYLSKNALQFSDLLHQYGLSQRGETPVPSELDALLRRWSIDSAVDKGIEQTIVATLGITSIASCSRLQRSWLFSVARANTRLPVTIK